MRGRVVITGIGALSPIGGSASESFENLALGKHGIRRIERFDPLKFGCKTLFASQVGGDFDARRFPPFKDLSAAEQTKQLRKLDRHQIYALIAAAEAIEMAKLDGDIAPEKLHRIGVNFSTGIGGLEGVENCTLVSQSGARQSPFGNLKFLPNIAAGYIASTWGFSGPNNAHCTACAASSHSIADGYNAIVSGEADIIVAGGSEAAITPVGIDLLTLSLPCLLKMMIWRKHLALLSMIVAVSLWVKVLQLLSWRILPMHFSVELQYLRSSYRFAGQVMEKQEEQ